MFNNKFSILSLPDKNKHYVLRVVSDSEGQVNLDIDNLKISATITAICDSYPEGETVVKNLIGD